MVCSSPLGAFHMLGLKALGKPHYVYQPPLKGLISGVFHPLTRKRVHVFLDAHLILGVVLPHLILEVRLNHALSLLTVLT